MEREEVNVLQYNCADSNAYIATVQNCEVCVHKVFHAFCSSRANPVCRLESGNPYHIWFILAILDI